MFCLVDCNNFYASCEQVFNPKLRNKPLVILSSNDGCVIARSKEAKALKIPMGTPTFKYKETFSRNNVIQLSSNFALYGDMSHRIMSILESEGFSLEIYSIDEAFMKLPFKTALDLNTYAKTLRTKLYQWTGISVSIGIAPTKTLAKVANKIAKSSKELGFVVIQKESIDKYLENFHISHLWGVGKSYSSLLQSYGILSALKLKNQSDEWIKKKMTVHGLKMVLELRGEPSIELEEMKLSRKSLVSSRSFGFEIQTIGEIENAISYFCSVGAEKLREENLLSSFLCVFICTNRFKKDYVSRSSHISLPFPTQSTITITKQALKCLRQIFIKGTSYKKAGIMLGDFHREKNSQKDLFSSESPKDAELMHVLDHINNKYGKKSLYLASEGHLKKWQPKQSLKTPLYTTSWKELLKVTI